MPLPAGFITFDQILSADTTEWLELSKSHINPFIEAQVAVLGTGHKVFPRSDGLSAWDRHGDEYLDFTSGFGALNLGHNHPAILEGIATFFMNRVPNLLLQEMHGLFPPGLAKALSLGAPGDLKYVLFSNGGAEAVDNAIKLARLATGRSKFIAAKNSFHGMSFGALSAMGPKFQEPLRPLLLPGVDRVPFGEIQPLYDALKTGDVAAVLLEPIQGEAGGIIPPRGYLKEVEALCRKFGTLLIIDEIQTGIGRTGKMFAVEHEDVVPHVIVLGKSLGGGIVPISACVTTKALCEKVCSNWDKYMLFLSTFSSNSFACALGLKTLEIIHQEDLLSKSLALGGYFMSGLRELQERFPVLVDVRGRGLYLALEFGGFPDQRLAKVGIHPSHWFFTKLMERFKIITFGYINNFKSLRVMPPLTATKAHVDYFLHALEATCADFQALCTQPARASHARYKSHEKVRF